MERTINREKEIYRVTLVGSLVNFVLVIFKFIAGIAGHSSAMISDAVHSLSDFFSDIVVLWFVKLSSRPQDEDHDYGHGRYETLASLTVGLFLGLVGIMLMVNSAGKCVRFFNGGDIGNPGWIALVAAVLSIFSKEWLFRYTMAREKQIDSPALVANAWHHRSDALTSIAALLGIGGAMIMGSKWSVLDPLAAAIVSVFIMKASYDLMKPNINELLEKALLPETKKRITDIILSTPDVKGMHRLRTRRIGPRLAISVHVKMLGSISLVDAHDIATEVERRLHKAFPEMLVTVHMEPV